MRVEISPYSNYNNRAVESANQSSKANSNPPKESSLVKSISFSAMLDNALKMEMRKI